MSPHTDSHLVKAFNDLFILAEVGHVSTADKERIARYRATIDARTREMEDKRAALVASLQDTDEGRRVRSLQDRIRAAEDARVKAQAKMADLHGRLNQALLAGKPTASLKTQIQTAREEVQDAARLVELLRPELEKAKAAFKEMATAAVTKQVSDWFKEAQARKQEAKAALSDGLMDLVMAVETETRVLAVLVRPPFDPPALDAPQAAHAAGGTTVPTDAPNPTAA